MKVQMNKNTKQLFINLPKDVCKFNKIEKGTDLHITSKDRKIIMEKIEDGEDKQE